MTLQPYQHTRAQSNNPGEVNMTATQKIYELTISVDGETWTRRLLAETANKAKYAYYLNLDADYPFFEVCKWIKSVRSLGVFRKRAPALNERELHLLEHTLGVGRHIDFEKWGYRNYFCGSGDGKDYQAFKAMENRGLVEVFIDDRKDWKDTWWARATLAGARALGLREQHLINAELMQSNNSGR